MTIFTRLFRRQPAPSVNQPATPEPAREMTDDRIRLEDQPYFLPKDIQEDERLQLQHKALYAALGNHFIAPIQPDIATLLDVGTGTGIWPVDMARLFPKAHIVGLDLASSSSFRYASNAACTFLYGDILKGLPFPEAQFDFVHQRLLVVGIPTVNWPDVIRELIRVTKPGGWIESLEVGVTVKNAGPETTRLLTWMASMSKERGIDLSVIPQLGDLLSQAGLQNVETQNIPAPLGMWGGRVGGMLKADVLSAFDAVKGAYCVQAKMPPSQFEAWVRIVADEWEQRHASYIFHAAFGKRAME